MSYFEIKKQDNVWHLEGAATLFELSRTKDSFNNRPAAGEWLIDCKNLTQIDTAGIALLLDFIRYSKHARVKIKIKSLPKAVKPLMEAQGVLAIINEHV